MPKPRALRPDELKRTLVGRFTGTQDRPGLADRLRQLHTKFGARSVRVFLVWTKWTGAERGEGVEQTIRELEILPTPKVSDLTGITMRAAAAGKYPEGSLRVDEVSATLAKETLTGRLIPGGPALEEPYDFFYELRDDGREGVSPLRQRFLLYGEPARKETNISWSLYLQRASADRTRSGQSSAGPVDPNDT